MPVWRKEEADKGAELYRTVLEERWKDRRKVVQHLVSTVKEMKSRGIGLQGRVNFLNGSLPLDSENLLNAFFC